MKIITRKNTLGQVVERWKSQYRKNVTFKDGKNSDDILLALESLNPITLEGVESIIGNDSWTFPPICDECGDRKDKVVMLGQEPDYESATASICYDCLKKALAMMDDDNP